MYEQVLREIRTAGEKHGIWKEIMYHPAQPPWNVSSGAKARIDEHTLHDTRNWITTTLADVTFVDGACFSFEAGNPVSLVNSATTLLQIVDEACEAHGLLVNMNDGKTEFSIEMTGVGARKQFKRLWREDRKAHLHFHKDGQKCKSCVTAVNMLTRSEPGHKIERRCRNESKQCTHGVPPIGSLCVQKFTCSVWRLGCTPLLPP